MLPRFIQSWTQKSLRARPTEDMSIHQFTRRRLAVAMLAIGLIMIAAWGWHVGRLALSLRDRAARVQRMAADPKQIRLAALAGEVHSARAELTALRDALVPLLWLGERLGGDLGIGRPLMDAAVESATAGDEALQALSPALGDLAPASLSMSAVPRVLDALTAARPALESASAHLDVANKAIGRIERPLSPRAEQLVEKAGKAVSLTQQGIGAALSPHFRDRLRSAYVCRSDG